MDDNTPAIKVDKRKIVTADRLLILQEARSKCLENRRRMKALKESKKSKDFLILLRDLIDHHLEIADDIEE